MDPEQGIVLGHRRLSILDLGSRANQPLIASDGRHAIVFNGEIYNFGALRKGLEAGGACFRTTSDTEVILALFARHGEAMLPMLQGMFAFVVWDRTTRRAFAARDPYGIKPLYYAKTGEATLFASQVRALRASGWISDEPSARGQAGFWMLGSVPEPHTWYRDVHALPAGHCAWIDAHAVATKRWFDIGDAWRKPADGGLPDGEVRERVRAALRSSVERHLVSDVPVSVFLSGGIDSGALAGLMVEAGARDLHGITIAYDDFAGTVEDEVPGAALTASYYGIRHHVRKVTRGEFVNDLPRIVEAMDQPSIDGINTWYASKAVSELGIKVVISGVGGDELFQGYSTFHQVPLLHRIARAAFAVPGASAAADSLLALKARSSGNKRWNHLTDWTGSLAGTWWLRRSVCSPEELPYLMDADLAREALVDFSPRAWLASMCGPLPAAPHLAVGLMESAAYLRNQLLRDSDWASMDHGIELRTPLVDASLLNELQPVLAALRRFPQKALLARAPRRALPDAVIARAKTGFSIPISNWAAKGSIAWAREVVELMGAAPA